MPRLSAAGASATKSAGCAIVISHDRWFLDRVATHILAFEGGSKVTFFDGTVRRLGDAIAHAEWSSRRPHRRGSMLS